jgi:pilus assembly protein CpaF
MRLETMVAMANLDIPGQFLRRYISSALHVVIQVSRLADGSRKLVSLQEIVGMEGDVVTMQEVFSFKQVGLKPDGKIAGHFRFNGVRPKFMELFAVHGIDPPPESFQSAVVLEV